MCRKVVSAFSHSWKRRRELAAIQDDKHLPTHLLIGDCKTRWGSSLKMIDRILEQQDAIRIVLSSDRTASHLILTWQDFDILASVSAVLTPLHQMTDLLSGEQYVTVSVVKPLLNHILSKVLLEKEDDSTLSKEIKARMRDKLNSYYDEESIDNLLTLCSFLDPRFKLTSDATIECVKEEMTALSGESGDSNGGCEDSGEFERPSKSPRKSMITLGKILGNQARISKNLMLAEKIDKELDYYTHLTDIDTDSCPLSWWKQEERRLPLLSKVAKKFLCICATSVSSERIFSTGGHIVSDNRTCLKPQMVDYLVFLCKNL